MDGVNLQRHYFSFQNLQLSYLDSGSSSKPTLVLIHGGQEHAHVWDHLVPSFTDHWRVIVPDLRGHGRSSWSSGGAYGVVEMAMDLLALIEHVQLEQITLIGHSLGGNVAVHFAGLFPARVNRLCVIEGLGLAPAAREKRNQTPRVTHLRQWADKLLMNSRKQKTRYATVEAAAAKIVQHDPRMPYELALNTAFHGLQQVEDGWIWRYDERILVQAAADTMAPEPNDIWQQVSCLVLLVYGRDSWASNPAEDGRSAYFTQVNVITVEGAGHNVHHHRSEEFLAIVTDFIEQ